MFADVQQGFTIEQAHRIYRLKFLNRAVFVDRLKISEKRPPLQPAGKASMVVDRDTHDDARQPDPKRAIPPESLDAPISAHERLLDNVLGVNRISRRSDCNLKQKGTVFPSSSFKINIFCPNSDRIHPSMSEVMTAPGKGRFRKISLFGCPRGFQFVQLLLDPVDFVLFRRQLY